MLSKHEIVEQLQKLRRKDFGRTVVGAVAHDYKLNPPLSVSVVETFEKKHSVAFPEDYRNFITEIGNGGAGPGYGLFPFGQHESHECDISHLVGDLSQPFPHTMAWNLPESFWEDEPDIRPGTPRAEEEQIWEKWDKLMQAQYWNPVIVNGAIPICDLGCGLQQWLIVTGEQKGFVWNDYRADDAGILPLKDASGNQMTFSDCYTAWLNHSLEDAILTNQARPGRSSRREWLALIISSLLTVLLTLALAYWLG